jgi:glycosyltransferase involved in cell wall biosynthesis
MSMNLNERILWIGQISGSATANPRYYELLRRFTCVLKVGYPPVRGISHLEGILIPWILRRFAPRFSILWDPGAKFTRWWPGKAIVDIDDPLFTEEEIRRLKDPRIEVIVTTTVELAERLHHETGKIVRVIPSGFSKADINPRVVQNIRKKLKMGLVVGYMSPYLLLQRGHQNDITLLLTAMEQVWKYEPSVDLWLIGHAHRLVKDFARCHSKVRLLGAVPRRFLLNYVCNFDIGVYPREVDHGGRFSVKLIEYMGCGVPIVATKTTETQMIDDARAGFRVEDVGGFVEAILSLVRNEALREEMKRNALNYSSGFDWDYLAMRYSQEIFGWR